MAGRRGNVRVSITGDASSLNRATRQAEGNLGRLGKTGSRSLRTLGASAKYAGAALGVGIGVEGKRAFDAFQESYKVTKQTEAVLKSTGGAAKVTAKEVSNLANSISLKAGMDDEAIQSAENLLLTFTKVRNETGKGNDVFNQTTKVVTDMSVALKQDLKSSSIQVGKALNDPIKGLTSLTRVGVSFDEKTKDNIESLVEQGKTREAQKIILRELQTEFGGSAAAQATAMDKAKVAVENLEESLGEVLAPTINSVATGIANFVNGMRAGEGAGGSFANAMRVSFGAVKTAFDATKNAVGTALNAINGFVAKNRQDINAAANALQNIGRAIAFVFTKWTLPVVRRVFPAIKMIVSGTLQTITGIIRVFSGILTGDFGKAWKGVKGIFSGSLKAILGLVRAATAPFREVASRIGAGVLAAFRGSFNAVVRVVRNAISSAVGIVRSYVDNYKRVAALAGRAVVAGFSIVREVGGRLAGFLGQAVRRVAGFANNFRSRAASVGAAIVNGLVAGVKSLPGKLAEVGKWLGNKVLGAVKSFLGISSPSKAFMEVGRNIVGGLAKGLDAGNVTGIVKKHFGGMASLAGKLVEKGTIGLASVPLAGLNKLFGGASLGGSMVTGGAGNLDMATKMAQKFGLKVNSGYRPGDPGWHGKNRARDYGGTSGWTPQSTKGMLAFAKFAAASFGSKLLELIYTPLGFGINNGKRVPLSFWGERTNQQHFDHVHVAMARGGKLKRPTVIAGEEAPRHPEYYISTNPRDRKRMVPLAAEALQNVVGMAKGGVVGTILKIGRSMGANWKMAAAAISAGIVESGLRNLNYGDRDSQGVFQQRPSMGWGRPGSVVQDTKDFFRAAKKAYRPGMSAAHLAQAVQRSAFPGRYGQQMNRAVDLIHGAGYRNKKGVLAMVGGKSGKAKPKPPKLVKGGLPGSYEDLIALNDLSMARAEGTAGRSDDITVLGRRQKILKTQRSFLSKRIKSLRKALRKPQTKAKRAKLTAELRERISQLTEIQGQLNQGSSSLAELQAPVEALGADIGGGSDLGGGGLGTDSTVSDNRAALAELIAEMVANQRRIIDINDRQGPQLLGAVIAAVNGGIGGRVGLGFQTPSAAGGLARY